MFRADLMISEGVKRAIQAMHDAALEAVGSGAQPVWLGLVGDVDAKQNVESFSTEGGKSGEKWSALSEPYATVKRRKVGRKKILVYGGQMRQSLTTRAHSDRIVRMTGNVIELGTRHHLARYHQDGTQRMPSRPPVRKSARQVHNLKLAIAKGVVSTAARIARGTAQGRILATVAAQIRPNPRE